MTSNHLVNTAGLLYAKYNRIRIENNPVIEENTFFIRFGSIIESLVFSRLGVSIGSIGDFTKNKRTNAPNPKIHPKICPYPNNEISSVALSVLNNIRNSLDIIENFWILTGGLRLDFFGDRLKYEYLQEVVDLGDHNDLLITKSFLRKITSYFSMF